uniref:Uncharacterized protein n=1 Tax=Anguilla anguilla TaxID=7936 RepID=A0A0E9QT61_ANGAN
MYVMHNVITALVTERQNKTVGLAG